MIKLDTILLTHFSHLFTYMVHHSLNIFTGLKSINFRTSSLPSSYFTRNAPWTRNPQCWQWQPEYNNPDKLKPLIDKLKAAFTQLNYEEPGNEAVLLNHVIESVSTEILKGNMDQSSSFMEFLLKRYGV